MRLFKNNRNCVIILILVIAGVIVSDVVYKSELKYKNEVGNFSRKLHRLEKMGSKIISTLIADNEILKDDLEELKNISETKGVSVARYRGEKLDIWSDNNFELPAEYDSAIISKPLQFIHNRWVITDYLLDENDIYLYFIDVFHKYDIENDFIHSGFDKNLGLPENTFFSEDPDQGYPVYNGEGTYLLSIEFDKKRNFNTLFLIVPFSFWLLFIIVAIALINRFVNRVTGGKEKRIGVLIISLISVLSYSVFLFTGKPDLINNLSLFSPYRYTAGRFIPSPGHMLILSGLLVYIAYSFFRWWPIFTNSEKSLRYRLIRLSLYFLPSVALFYIFNLSLGSFIESSNISFEFFRILEMDSFTIVSFLASSLILIVLLFYLLKIFVSYSGTELKILFMGSIPAIILLVLIYIANNQNPLFQLVTFILLLLIIRLFRNRRSVIVVFTVSLSIISGAYSAWFVSFESWDTESEKMKVMAVNQIGTNDHVAEALLIDNWDRLNEDTILNSMMNLEFFIEKDVNDIYRYLDTAYFTGYWEQYDIIYTVCNFDSPLEIEETDETEILCFDFFNSRVSEYGIPVIDSCLYLIDNRSGRPYYLATLYFDPDSDTESRTGLFIDIISRIDNTLPGYPELLQNKKYQNKVQIKKYSVAKYIGDSLVLQTGNYPFDQKLKIDTTTTGEFRSFSENDFECLVYNHSPTVSVVIARPSMKFQNILITFTYIFIIFFVLFTSSLMVLRPPDMISLYRLDFRQKLQYSFILLLLGSIVAIGAVVISLSISQYGSKHMDNISEKLSSVSIELDHKLSNEEVLSWDWNQDTYPDLDALLIKFSNVFFTDINLYTTDGFLLASSRREVFDKNLKGALMDFRAFSELNTFGESQFIQEETVGGLTYLSAYTPFLNYRNEVLAYLNLPYFAVQDKLSEDVSNLVATIINFSLILIVISMGIAVFIAVQITNPLRMLREGLASVSLDSESNKLEYSGHDEISELVNQYNDMLEQLHQSAVKLALSEREDAWRDMAKQIAHEIKNPLTPMKLNVQQLLKSWEGYPEDFNTRLERFSDNMIENIDNLSSIATEFSHFARMPQANPKKIDLVSQINSSAELFGSIKNVDLIVNLSPLTEVIIYADKEQITSMLTNIIRNAVQAVPSNKKGRVEVGLKLVNKRAIITVSDNGVGIPRKLGEKLFVPNFTTKSSGMGIGLALVKRIVETAGGSIKYESEVGVGTTFIMEFPILS